MDALGTYIDGLPDGLDSFPRVQCKGNVLDEQIEWVESTGLEIDPRIRPAIKKAKPFGQPMDWVPEVLISALSLNARLGYPSDEAWIRAIYHRQSSVYRRPLYRALMLVMSPTLMTMGAADRWGAYRRGTELVVDRWTKDGRGRATTGTIRHPAGVYDELLLRGMAPVLRSAIDAAGATNSVVELLEEETRPGEARYRMRYEG